MIKKSKSIITIGAIGVIGIALILLSSITIRDSTNQTNSLNYDEYTSTLEKKIEDFLLSINGIYKAKVIITLETSSEQVYAQNQSTYDFLTISSNDGEYPVHITEIYPTIRGIAISCTNGDKDETKMRLTKLLSAYLGISSNRIEIVSIK